MIIWRLGFLRPIGDIDFGLCLSAGVFHLALLYRPVELVLKLSLGRS